MSEQRGETIALTPNLFSSQRGAHGVTRWLCDLEEEPSPHPSLSNIGELTPQSWTETLGPGREGCLSCRCLEGKRWSIRGWHNGVGFRSGAGPGSLTVGKGWCVHRLLSVPHSMTLKSEAIIAGNFCLLPWWRTQILCFLLGSILCRLQDVVAHRS